MPFIDIVGDEVNIYPHAGQVRALQSPKRIVLVVSGAQGGKTSLGPLWLHQEIQRRGPGDYMVVTPTYSLLDKSALPKFREWFEDVLKLGTYVGGPNRRFVFSPDGERRTWGHEQSTPTTVHFGYATNSDSLEAITLLGAWCDEAGQKSFAAASFENILNRRCAVNQARILVTTTPYTIDGYLRELCEKAEAGDPNIELIRFDSVANPAFPQESWDHARATMAPWRFDLMHRAIWSRPAGQIYDCFRPKLAPEGHLVKRFPIPDGWKRYCGLDFGSVNFASVHIAKGEDSYEGKYVVYRTIHGGGTRVAADRVPELLKDEPGKPITYGGSGSEDQFRAELTAAGLKVNKPPIHEVEPMIDRVYAMVALNELLIFDDLKPFIKELTAYSRKTDGDGKVLDEIENKSAMHYCDALRYIVSHIKNADVKNRILRPMAPRYGGGFA